MVALDIWIKAHPALANDVFSEPMIGRLERIRERLAQHGYTLKLDVGKRSTRATVKSPTFCARSSCRSLKGFLHFEEARLDAMDERARLVPTPSP